MAKTLTAISLPRNPNVVKFRPTAGSAWRGFAAPQQPRSPAAHAARAQFQTVAGGWQYLSPTDQANYRAMAADSGGRFANGFGVYMNAYLNAPLGTTIDTTHGYEPGGPLGAVSISYVPTIGLQAQAEGNEASPSNYSLYVMSRTPQPKSVYNRQQATRLPGLFPTDTATLLDPLWPLYVGSFPPFGQQLVAWFTPINAFSYISGPVRMVIYQMPDA